MSDGFHLRHDRVRRSFARAAESYDAAAVLQREVLNRLVERLDLVSLKPVVVLDAGTGTGLGAAALSDRFRRFLDMHDVGDALVRSGFRDPVMDVERMTVTYEDTMALMRDLQAIGARNVNAGRPRGLTGPRRLRAMQAEYEAFRRDGSLPASWEVVFGQAWAPPAGVAHRDPGQPGEARIPIEAIARRSRGDR
ncbi:MAG: hypothetical protein LC632_03280 [Xanthomonadaceae bacterium]|nr:hypothetical protein [Xanthomonadaceae bacterium]